MNMKQRSSNTSKNWKNLLPPGHPSTWYLTMYHKHRKKYPAPWKNVKTGNHQIKKEASKRTKKNIYGQSARPYHYLSKITSSIKRLNFLFKRYRLVEWIKNKTHNTCIQDTSLITIQTTNRKIEDMSCKQILKRKGGTVLISNKID